jgi:hypothetical protein
LKSRGNDYFRLLKKEKQYWQELGRFIDTYTSLELMLNFVALAYSRIDIGTAKALFLPLRVDAATNLINKIIDVKKMKGERIKEIKEIFQ